MLLAARTNFQVFICFLLKWIERDQAHRTKSNIKLKKSRKNDWKWISLYLKSNSNNAPSSMWEEIFIFFYFHSFSRSNMLIIIISFCFSAFFFLFLLCDVILYFNNILIFNDSLILLFKSVWIIISALCIVYTTHTLAHILWLLSMYLNIKLFFLCVQIRWAMIFRINQSFS